MPPEPVVIRPGRELEAHVHAEDDDAFYIVTGEMTFVLAGETVAAPPLGVPDSFRGLLEP
ncbi:MAG: hypothetical protein QOF76_4961 [Solirubrobacteraceae bacterium]|nr:hypothetical protein [Solirubrobacteraceae bacterium]